jgi:hypothetical protein
MSWPMHLIVKPTARPGTSGQVFADVYRTLSEDETVDRLLLEGFAFAADQAAARIEARRALDRWIAGGMRLRRTREGLLFDPVEVMTFVTAAGIAGEDDFWERCLVATLRRFVMDLHREDSPCVRLHYRRRFDVSRIAGEEALRLRMPLPLPQRHASLHIIPELPAEASGHRLSDGRLEVRVTTTGAAEICLGARLEFAVGNQCDQTPPDTDLYLRAREGLVVITPQVADLATSLAGPGATPEIAIRSFWDFLIDNFSFCPVHYDQVPADSPLDWVIETGIYDCQLAAAFLVALCRARGIKGRVVGGNFLYRRSPTNHYWAEIWLDNSGWTPFDFICWDLSRGGEDAPWRNLFFGRIEPRLITECLPTAFTGAIGVPVPPKWHILRAIKDAGVEIHLTGVDGNTVYRDQVTIL